LEERRQQIQTAAPSGWRQLARHHLASIVATAADYLVMVLGVEVARLGAVTATAFGASAGAIVNFIMGRRLTYMTADLPATHQVWRYGLVSLASLALNTGGEYFFHVVLSIEYLLARLITSVIVSNAWNYPMQRYFVFARPREQV
jgi:putative flippase GtrA